MGSADLKTAEAKKLFKEAFVELSSGDSRTLAEAAFPAYAHRNPLIDRIFWGRLSAVEEYLSKLRLDSVLDFGCGSGVMSYIVASHARSVTATDIEPSTFDLMRERVEFPPNVGFAGLDDLGRESFRGAFDVVIALDVLEHVDDLDETLYLFKRVLKPDGVAVISGPTENLLYKIGRRLAGREFTGDYHVSDIVRIKEGCSSYGTVTDIRKIYPMLPLFDVFSLKFD